MKLFIFGATGDLVKRKVLPALQELSSKEDFEIIALGRKEMSGDQYISGVCDSCSVGLKKIIRYKKIDFDKNLFNELAEDLDKNGKNYFYVSLPPKMLKDILVGLREICVHNFNIFVLLEKPFGYDLESAKELRDIIGDFGEKVFLADHYLFKEEVVKMRGDFRKIKFVFLEKVGLEGRSYYDEIGAIRDMVQSHFLNLLFRIRKDLRHDLRLFSVEKFSRMQYDEYESELGKKSNTETFVDLVLKSGKNEFEFVTGKAFEKKQSCVFIDGKRIDFNEKVNPYIRMFEEFFKSNREVFPKVEDAIFSWELIKWVLKHKSVLGFYSKGKDFICENI